MTAVDVTGPAVRGLSRPEIATFVHRTLRALDRAGVLDRPVTDVSIAFVADREMTRLNTAFRGKRKTTDVLTFPAEETPEGSPLGDIVISLDQARRQARIERHALAIEIRYLVLHGILHALGYDHETDDGEMNALELKLRSRVGLK